MDLKIGISAWSFYRRFLAKPPTMDYPQFFAAVRGLGVDAVELNSPFFDSQEHDYITNLKGAADSYGVHINNIAIDDGGYDLSSADSANREDAINRTVRWMDSAVILGCPNVRNNTGGQGGGAPKALELCIDSFARLTAEAEERGLNMVIENHGGISANPDELVTLIKRINSDHIGTVPDFGNFRADIRYQAIEKVAPFAKQIHPKMHDFDENGEQPEWDTARLVNIVKKTGFGGWDVVDSVATIDHMTFPVEGDGGTYDEQNLWNRNNHWHPTRTADHVCEDGAYYRLQAYTRVQPPGGFGGYVKKTRYTYWDFA